MANLPLNLPQSQRDTRWKSIIDPLLSNPMTNMSILPNVSLVTGVNVINHGLQQMQQGWVVTDIQGSATVYRSAPFNNLTLTLTASAPVVMSIAVF